MNTEDDNKLDLAIDRVVEALISFLVRKNTTVTRLELEGTNEKALRIEFRSWGNSESVRLYSALTEFESARYQRAISNGNFEGGSYFLKDA